MAKDIRTVKTITDLIEYFSTNLGWNIDMDDFDDIEDVSYDFEAEDIGLKEESFAKISSLRQLQNLVDGQKWGIFCVEFDSKKFEPSALKKILSGLIPRKRNSADHAVWCQQDLLFICNWGTDNNSTIGLAHFEDRENGLPQIKMFSCAPALEDFTQIKNFEERLSQLSWPKNTGNIDEWREVWSSAFTMAYKQTIQDSSSLTIQLAAEAQNIRNRILEILDVETKNGYVHRLYEKFRDSLIHDMSINQFADMYAQTVVYGLFSARCMDKTQEDFSADEAIECIPNTNPFLKSLMKECFGTKSYNKLSFDELEIGNVVDLLLHTKTDEIIKDFNRQTGGGKEDPVIHFYEEFLSAYDKNQKVQRGVFYTPQPVVNFIVGGVDYLLKNEFNYLDGLASTDKKRVKVFRDSKKRIDGIRKKVEEEIEVPAIQILDPATGTGTFLRQVILQIYNNFMEANKGKSNSEIELLWNNYVDKNLLTRVNGFELMMAPYAVAHMKLAMVLKDTGYDFSGENRLNVFLTNTLEEPGKSDNQISLFDEPLAIESIEANRVKKNLGINVVLGNPPYSGVSANNNQWITRLIDDYKYSNGEYFNEKKHWLNDDYVKFIRYAQNIISSENIGIMAYICPHGFIDNPTFRAMRWNLLQQYDDIYIVNLHGNSNRKEKCPDGTKDENVFDIQQGVSICFFVKKSIKKKLNKVYYYDLYGDREYKYDFLGKNKLCSIKWENVIPQAPFYLFRPDEGINNIEYTRGIKITDLFPKYTSGIITSRDALAIDFDKNNLLEKINYFTDFSVNELKIRQTFFGDGNGKGRPIGDSSVWSLTKCREQIKDNNHNEYIRPITYRPFDFRYIYYSSYLIHRTREDVIGNMYEPNIAIITARSNKSGKCDHFYISQNVAEAKCGESTTQSAIFPLFVGDPTSECVLPNLNIDIVNRFEKILSLKFNYKKKDCGTIESEFGPYDVLYYVYAVFNSKKYREKNKDNLVMDYPIIPYPTNLEKFKTLSLLGRKISEAHLMKLKEKSDIDFQMDNGSCVVEKYQYDEGKVWINKTQYFDNIRDEDWSYSIGGYQPLQKWLKDRKGMCLSCENIEYYRNIVSAIRKALEIMEKIDEVIEV